MDKMVFIVDLGHFKAYQLTKTDQDTPRLELVNSFDSIEALSKMSEKVSDGPGRFGGRGGVARTPRGYGEPHNSISEEQKRLLKILGQTISDQVRQNNPDSWYLAAERSILKQLVDTLEQSVAAKLAKQVPANLTKAGKNEIIERFL